MAVKSCFRKLRWVRFDHESHTNKAVLVHNIINSAVSQHLCSRFVPRSDTLSFKVTTYGDHERLAVVPLPRTNDCHHDKRSLTQITALLWSNGLPLDLGPSLDLFRPTLKYHVFQSER